MTAVEIPETPARARSRVWWIAVAVVMGLHAAAAAAQPILAGAYLNGSLAAISVHEILGTAVGLLGLLQIIATLVYRLVARGPWWPFLASVALFVLEVLQVGLGYARSLGLHVPLGVLVVAVAVVLFVIFLRRPVTPR